jgi:hypothetical protein
MIEVSGSVPLTKESGSGWPKNILIRIRNTDDDSAVELELFKKKKHEQNEMIGTELCPLVQYAEIADIHPVPADLEVTTLTHVSDVTTLPKA